MRMRDEVVYVLIDPQRFIGQNQNEGSSYRRGLEAEAHVSLPAGFSVFAAGSYQENQITSGPYAGTEVPMVPRTQGSAGAEWTNPDWSVRLGLTCVGRQRLDNDLTNARPQLPGYATLDLSARYAYRALTVEASVTNLLDKQYASHGVTNGVTDYFTPADPAAFKVAVTWSF